MSSDICSSRLRGEKEKERVRGIEPPCAAWEAAVLPLNYTREIEIFDFRFSKPTIIGSPNQFKVYSFRGCRLQPKQIVSANRLFTLDATIIATKLRRRSLYRC